MAEDYYKILGVEKTATTEDIKKSYRKLAHRYHPDKKGGDEEKFKQLNEAYQILGDDNKRAQYDQFGQAFSEGAGGRGPFGFGSNMNINMEDLGGIGDIFETFFGGQRTRPGRPRTRRGEDVQVDVEISFRESAQELQREIATRLYLHCEHCQGNGAQPGTPIVNCGQCNGQGVIGQARQTPFGVFTNQAICPQCQGEGKIAQTPCSVCRGEGRQLRSQRLTVTIPAGIADGQLIRLSGKGQAAPRGGLAGDLYVTVHVRPQPGLTREGNHVLSSVKVSFVEAILGTKVNIETLSGSKELTVPPGMQPGALIRLTGAGFVTANSSRGDQIIRIEVEIPKKVSKIQRKLLEEYRKAKRGLFS